MMAIALETDDMYGENDLNEIQRKMSTTSKSSASSDTWKTSDRKIKGSKH